MNVWYGFVTLWGFPGGASGKEPACQRRTGKNTGRIPGLARSPRGGHATHSSIIPWRIPGTEEPGGLQSMGSQEADSTEAT